MQTELDPVCSEIRGSGAQLHTMCWMLQASARSVAGNVCASKDNAFTVPAIPFETKEKADGSVESVRAVWDKRRRPELEVPPAAGSIESRSNSPELVLAAKPHRAISANTPHPRYSRVYAA